MHLKLDDDRSDAFRGWTKGFHHASLNVMRVLYLFSQFHCSSKRKIAALLLNNSGFSALPLDAENRSTAIKILIGELKATKGEVYRHPNLRLAYIAQHAFQHLEKHLTQTPTQYILERFAGNDDKENIVTTYSSWLRWYTIRVNCSQRLSSVT